MYIGGTVIDLYCRFVGPAPVAIFSYLLHPIVLGSGGGREEGRSSYSLYILGANGVLVKHCLQPRKLESAPDGEDAPIMLHHHSQMQWRLMG